jgi:hypothetical protein
VVVTYDHDGAGSTALLRCFHNGAPVGELKTDLRLRDVEDAGHRIGPFAGRFDEVRIYDRALTPAEVLASFTAGPDRIETAGGNGR